MVLDSQKISGKTMETKPTGVYQNNVYDSKR